MSSIDSADVNRYEIVEEFCEKPLIRFLAESLIDTTLMLNKDWKQVKAGGLALLEGINIRLPGPHSLRYEKVLISSSHSWEDFPKISN